MGQSGFENPQVTLASTRRFSSGKPALGFRAREPAGAVVAARAQAPIHSWAPWLFQLAKSAPRPPDWGLWASLGGRCPR